MSTIKVFEYRVERLWWDAAGHRTLPHQSLVTLRFIISPIELAGNRMPYTLIVENHKVSFTPRVRVDVRRRHGLFLEGMADPSNLGQVVDDGSDLGDRIDRDE